MRHAGVAVLALLGFLPTARADEPSAEARAFVEIVTPRDTFFVHETIPVRLRFGIDRDYFDAHAVPLFRQEMDVPVQIEAPWVQELTGTTVLGEPAASDPLPARLRFVLNGEAAEGVRADDVERDGRVFTVVEVVRRFRALAPGALRLSGTTLRFAYATEFEEDFVGGRVAIDRRVAKVAARSHGLLIHALPAEGRPDTFVDAVGRFEVDASAVPTLEGPASNLLWTLTIEGEGNLDLLTPPPADRLRGFHVYGVIDDVGAGRRTLTYEIAATSDRVSEIPAVPFAFFDPLPPAGYRVVRTKAISISVGPADDGGADASAPPERATGEAPTAALFVVGLVVLLIAALWIVRIAHTRRRARERAQALAAAPGQQAAADLRRRLDEPDADPAQAFAEYLSARLHVSRAAVIGPALPSRLLAAGLYPALADHAAETLKRLVAARYGGESTAEEARSKLRSLVEELEDAFPTPGESGPASS
ncbi:MAG: hypothetical protein ACYTG6_07720 [Planctomycetota bacterium]